MPNGNHKAKTYSRCIKIKRKEIKYTTKEIIKLQKEDSKRGGKDQKNHKTSRK